MLAVYCMLFSAIADFFDGLVARALNVFSPLGKELDSLADGVSFGVLPALLFHQMAPVDIPLYLSLLWIAIAVCSILRLGIFNLDTRQTSYFIGVPTPANALFIAVLFSAYTLHEGCLMV
jgi:CDP-diacylglycerol--serine O-phosphatidyltransferase